MSGRPVLGYMHGVLAGEPPTVNAFVVALERMAAEERQKAADWRRVARWRRTPYHWSALHVAEPWAAEHDARAQVYGDWAKALSFPGGPVHVDYVRYGCRREAIP